ncbi:hypothetical protein [Mesorhizobium sp. ESP-6-2]|uniref:hypothetical protein n=1 Tax=Mesorhizobium sp. ESP-6-2 TaxID=2876625 RepID=UPI001CCE5EDB|nr:hypothetical protein [Mesorhizobium sp. ESP-6-2]MBZ9807661.1 hypothetical protein [Mesorhizobium sp. ESP-6-2]
MSEMIERVAKAIHSDSSKQGAGHGDFDALMPEVQDSFRSLARAAIKAMMSATPTPPDVVEMAIQVQRQFKDKFAKAAGDGEKTGLVACELAAAAILAERARCAKLAENHSGTHSHWFGEANSHQARESIARVIADDIRQSLNHRIFPGADTAQDTLKRYPQVMSELQKSEQAEDQES